LATKSTKDAKEGKGKGLATEGTKGAKAGSVILAEDILVKLDSRRTEVDEHAVLNAGGAKIAENLGGVLFREGANRLELNDELLIDDKVGNELSQRTAVLVVNSDGHLLFDREAFFPEAVAQGVFINFLIMSVTEEGVSFEGRLTNGVG
jgi:hypothetical protein